MEQLKHECGVALIRLRKPIEYYRRKYGTYSWALDKLYLLMEKQHNRGQEGAGLGVVKLHSQPGNEYVYRERALGSDAIQTIFENVHRHLPHELNAMEAADVEEEVPFIGEIYMGHLRYSTTGKAGMSYVHPFLRRNNWRSRNLLMCGNFNMTNVDEVFQTIVARGQHPRLYSDTIVLLEQIGYALDKENHRLYREFRNRFKDPELGQAIEDNIDMARVLKATSPLWDGGYVICGATGSGDMFALRDPHGIRPAFYYADDEVVVVASERPVIQTVFHAPIESVKELTPGQAIMVGKHGQYAVRQIQPEGRNERCSFERIYFSRGSDRDIYNERKALGANLVPKLVEMLDGKLQDAVFSFIPNTAEVAFMGMEQELARELDRKKMAEIKRMAHSGTLDDESLLKVMRWKVRTEKAVLKDIKLRTFIAETDTRNDLAAHVYDITYGTVRAGEDTLVVIDDSIVRGTTLKRSIVTMLDRLQPKRIIIVSSSPQVRYPDCYGIDMSRMGEFIAFKAAIELLKERGMQHVIDDVYAQCQAELLKPAAEQRNAVKGIYAPFTDEEISAKIAQMVTGPEIKAKVDVLYQSIDGLHKAVPGHPGDWYFSGNYPTPGGVRLVNRAFVNYYEGNPDKR
ncbi:MAG: amidophosphoribosyltransferase [Muribaculaceae bacterium]|nr:amidophosphoribosyltransferase [Muribaculaceae bacterium]